jgi:predicted RNase H-like HicB family nuclease
MREYSPGIPAWRDRHPLTSEVGDHEMAIELAGRVEIDSPPAGAALPAGQNLSAIAIFDGHQWASLCPELDLASVGATADEAIDNLVEAVSEAIAFAREQGLDAGRPVPSDDLRSFLISSQAPYVGRTFFA